MRWSTRNIRPRLDWFVTPVRGDVALRPLVLWLAAIGVGIVAGLGAVAFRALIAFFHSLFFLAQFSISYDANAHTPPGPWGPFIILAPVVGALCVAVLVKNFAPEAKGHGVPEVMDAIYYDKGVIRPIVALVKSVASAMSIGSGGSVGREGPIIQIGAGFGSTLGQVLRLSLWQRITLIAAGTGGDRGHFQYAGWRGVICARDHNERSQRQDPGSSCDSDGNRHLHRTTVLRPAPVVCDSGLRNGLLPTHQTMGLGLLRRARSADGTCLGTFYRFALRH